MPYQFDRTDESVANALRRIAERQLATAARAGDPPNIHAMRKSIKKTRALLRLARGRLDSAADLNARLRDIGRAISASRDAQVLPLTAQSLAATSDKATAALLSRAGADLARARSPDADTGSIALARADLAALARGTADWRITGKGFAVLSGGLEHTLARTRDAAAHAAHLPNAADAIHDWRKRVKDHWYHARLLTPIWPDLMRPHATATGRVGELLGLHQDIQVLLARLPDTSLTAAEADAIRAHALVEATALRTRATTLAARVFADRPGTVADRWRVWWNLWRKGG